MSILLLSYDDAACTELHSEALQEETMCDGGWIISGI